LSRTGELRPSVEELRKAVELDTKYAEPHYLLGQLYQKLGQRGDAEREFALFREISKETPTKKQ